MNEDMIQIEVDENILLNSFPIEDLFLDRYRNPFGKYLIEKEKYDQVEFLLSEEYGIHDQTYINAFCVLIVLFRGNYNWWENHDPIFHNWIEFIDDISRLAEYLKDYEIKSILFKGDHKITKHKKSESFDDANLIKEVVERISFIIERYEFNNNQGLFETDSFKKKAGAKPEQQADYLRGVFYFLCKFLHVSPFPNLNDLSKTEEEYFAGRLFLISDIIKSKPYTTAYKNKSVRYYLIQTMKKYRINKKSDHGEANRNDNYSQKGI
jgi:hypothetical protein